MGCPGRPPRRGGGCPGTHGRIGARQGSRAFGNTFDFREHQGCLGFEGLLHLLVILFREFAGAIFELQIAQIIVNDVAALQKLIEQGAVRRRIDGIGLGHEDKNQHRGCERDAGDHGDSRCDIQQARHEQGKPVFTNVWDWVIFILAVIGAVVGVWWLATGYITI